MAKQAAPVDSFHAHSRAEWRAWLEAHHASSSGVWLINYKKETGKPRFEYAEAVEEALCFGWVDSRPGKVDEERYKQLFSPRSPKSPWSKLNKERVERLIAEGKMTPAGFAKIEAAKQNGAWTAYDAIEALTIPTDLTDALQADDTARTHFDAFPATSKKNILWWIDSAKRPETRAKRVAETVALAAKNIKANHFRQ